jgi:hypothetical protein
MVVLHKLAYMLFLFNLRFSYSSNLFSSILILFHMASQHTDRNVDILKSGDSIYLQSPFI